MKTSFSSIMNKIKSFDFSSIADRLTDFVGSWKFIIMQSFFLMAWMITNFLLVSHFKVPDPYPFQLLNLLLGCQAAFTGPIVLISQNRQSAKDRLTLLKDLEYDKLADSRLVEIKQMIEHINRKMK
jgi:uncharacterized membrane protein